MSLNYVICHYSEIGLKGKNRKYFEEKLIYNIKRQLGQKLPSSFKYIKRISGRIIIELTDKGIANQSKIKQVLKNVFGLAYFAFALNSKQNIDDLASDCLGLLKDRKFKTFRITTQRSKKDFPLKSQTINEKIGALIVKKLNKKVKLKKPDITCFVAIVEKYSFIYLKKNRGPGGLPVGVSGQAIVLLSGGIDSPVAAYYVLKRGVDTIYLHFFSAPYTTEASINKVKKIIRTLNKFRYQSKLYLVPFSDIQKEILLKTPDKFRVILYRRFMIRIAQTIAKKEKAIALVSGESIGQVASQTIANIKVISEVAKLPVLRPLIGFDKEEIIQQSKKISLFQISILPHQDCCARFLPKHPATKANSKEIKEVEQKLDIKKMTAKAIKETRVEVE